MQLTHMNIPTESIGSIPRPLYLLEALEAFSQGKISQEKLDDTYQRAIRETIEQLEKVGSPIVTDGEQTKSSFVTYPLCGICNLASDGVVIPFADGHSRQLPRLTAGPFRFGVHAGSYVRTAKRYTKRPVKQAVISPSALSLLYPSTEIAGYDQNKFTQDLIAEAVADIRECFAEGAQCVQFDFTEARLSLKLDPSKKLLQQFIDLNNKVIEHFTPEERQRLGVHTCPGGDWDTTHSADVDYAALIPDLFKLKVGNFYMQLASEKAPEQALRAIKENLRPNQRVFVGVIDVLSPEVEDPETVKERILCAADYIPVGQLGTTDDCGFSPFGDDTSTGRETAFAKIKSRILGTRLAEEILKPIRS
jgi:5-methyltetrahydropteroyltriglutamate--homocysteine methyltransferase